MDGLIYCPIDSSKWGLCMASRLHPDIANGEQQPFLEQMYSLDFILILRLEGRM